MRPPECGEDYARGRALTDAVRALLWLDVVGWIGAERGGPHSGSGGRLLWSRSRFIDSPGIDLSPRLSIRHWSPGHPVGGASLSTTAQYCPLDGGSKTYPLDEGDRRTDRAPGWTHRCARWEEGVAARGGLGGDPPAAPGTRAELRAARDLTTVISGRIAAAAGADYPATVDPPAVPRRWRWLTRLMR